VTRALPAPAAGTQFARLTVISGEAARVGKRRAVECRCECGRERLAVIGDLLSAHVKTCGQCLYMHPPGR